MFDFLGSMARPGSYEQRAVDRYEDGNLIIDTAAVTDSTKPYETGIKHPKYNHDSWVIVELYNTKEEAQKGHDRWVETFKKEFPKSIKDVSTSDVVDFAKGFGVDLNCEYVIEE